MKPLWSGAISFGLVNIPVNLYSATRERAIQFDYLRKKDLCPVGYLRVCKKTGEEVAYKDIVRGYEYQKGDYAVIEEEDFRKANVKKTQLIDIVDFVEEKEIDSKFFEKPYYIEPDKKANKAYALLRQTLHKTKRVGIAKFVMRSKEHLVMIKAEEDLLLLVQLRFL